MISFADGKREIESQAGSRHLNRAPLAPPEELAPESRSTGAIKGRR